MKNGLLASLTQTKDNGNFYPASGGTEEPFTTRSGHKLLYVWQPSTGRHAYLDVERDIVLSERESDSILSF